MPGRIDTDKLGPIHIGVSKQPTIEQMLRVLDNAKANGNPAHYLAGINVAEAHAIASKLRAMRNAMQNFCDRVDRGEVRSKRTYAEFKGLLG